MLSSRFLIKFLTITLLLVTSLSVSAKSSDPIEIVISRSTHILSIKKGDVTIERIKVAFGSGGRKAKLKEGDRTTPKGTYRISKIRDSENFHTFMLLNYPNMEDAKRALKSELITRKEYRAILIAHIEGRMPPQNTALGGTVGLHGIGIETEEKLEIHQYIDWTKGCIAMRNKEIDKLNFYVQPGTKVTIGD